MSSDGVPLDLSKGDHQAVIVLSVPCCNHHGSRQVSENRDSGLFTELLDTAEHAIIVAGLTLKTEYGDRDAATQPLPLQLPVPTPPFRLTYGQVIALGGDFYGSWIGGPSPTYLPVCMASDPVWQFGQNFLSLVRASAEVYNILQVANKFEFQPIARAVRYGQQPSAVYAGLPTTGPHLVSDEDRAFDEATGGSSFPTPINGRYLNLASENFDHFGVDAIACYRAGHTFAQTEAVKAKQEPDPAKRDLLLKRAYAINAFADHFLTDLFAAGHMRTPRHALFNSAMNSLTQIAASLCAKQMHDEDNKFGLWVDNSVDDTWVAYGDGRYRDSWNAASRVVAKKALQQSMDDVWNAFQDPSAVSSGAANVLRYLPKVITEITQMPTAPIHRDDPRNWAPLFSWDPNKNNVNRRNNLYDPSDRTFCEQGTIDPRTWGLSTTVAQLLKNHQVLMPQREYAPLGVSFPPYESGMTGEYGWPAGPTTVVPGINRPMYGATGPDLYGVGATSWNWRIDGAPGPTTLPGPNRGGAK